MMSFWKKLFCYLIPPSFFRKQPPVDARRRSQVVGSTSNQDIILIAVISILVWNCSGVKQEPLPILSTVPDFSLTERSGQPFGLNDLRGHVWVADFIFTNCAGTCPIMTTAMTEIQQTALAEKLDDVKLVSITVDPEGDSAGRQIISNCLALLPVSLLPTILGMAGRLYFVGALALSLFFLGCGIAVMRRRTNDDVRRLLRASLVYLPMLLALMALDKTTF